MNAAELHEILKIETPFKDWVAAQIRAGRKFTPFFGILPDGKLGKNYRLSDELAAEVLKQCAPKPPKVKPAKQKTEAPKLAQDDPLKEVLYSIAAYNETFLNRTLTDKAARHDGISLSGMVRVRGLEIGKVEHPVWQQVNAYPKFLLDKYYAKHLKPDKEEPDGGK